MTRVEPLRYYVVLAAVLCLVGIREASAQSLTIERYVTLSGTVEAVGPGSLVAEDEQGGRHEFQIAEPGEATVALKKAGLLLRAPVEVHISGKYPRDALSRGSLVRFQGRVNRAGDSEGLVHRLALLEDTSLSTGVETTEKAASAREYVDATIMGTVHLVRGDRLVVTVGDNGVTHRDRIAFTLAEDVVVQMASDSYRRAEPGDRIVSLKAAVLSSGDQIVQQVTIDKSASGGSAIDGHAALVAKYRHLSDEPGPIRDVRSRHFLLHTDISPRSAAILLDKLEMMIGLVSGYFGRPPRQIIECYVVRDPGAWPSGLLNAGALQSIGTGGGVTQTVSLGRRVKSIVYATADYGTVQHEAVHAYCNQTFGSAGPVWYAEGMAEMGNYWKVDQPAVSIPAAAVNYLRNSPPKSMAELVAAGQITGDSWEAYQWRWALCYLLANNPNYARHFKALGIGLMTEAPGVSFESVYGSAAGQIAFEYQHFLTHLDNGYRVDLCAWQWQRKWRPLVGRRRAVAEVDAQRGWQATGATLEKGEAYEYVAQGEWSIQPGDAAMSADGSAGGAGRLTGMVMKEFQMSEPFELGTRGSFVAPTDGDLYVRCGDAWNQLADNGGELTLHLRKASE